MSYYYVVNISIEQLDFATGEEELLQETAASYTKEELFEGMLRTATRLYNQLEEELKNE